MENKDIENLKHIQKTYTDKSINLLKICIGISIFSFLTYLYAILVYGSFDFGLVFEIVSFIFVVLAFNKVRQNNFEVAKRNSIIAMIPIGWLIIYDFVNLLANIDEVFTEVVSYYMSFDQYFYYLEPYLYDVTLVASFVFLYKTYLSLCRADGTKQADNCTDTFYDNL